MRKVANCLIKGYSVNKIFQSMRVLRVNPRVLDDENPGNDRAPDILDLLSGQLAWQCQTRASASLVDVAGTPLLHHLQCLLEITNNFSNGLILA